MGTRTAEIPYTCYNDCQMSGCPGHLAKVYVQTTSDYISFTDGGPKNHGTYEFDPETLRVFRELLKRVDY